MVDYLLTKEHVDTDDVWPMGFSTPRCPVCGKQSWVRFREWNAGAQEQFTACAHCQGETVAMSEEERIAREILAKANDFAKQPDNPEGPDLATYLMDLIVAALRSTADMREALEDFIKAYGSQDSGSEGLDKAMAKAKAALTRQLQEREKR